MPKWRRANTESELNNASTVTRAPKKVRLAQLSTDGEEADVVKEKPIVIHVSDNKCDVQKQINARAGGGSRVQWHVRQRSLYIPHQCPLDARLDNIGHQRSTEGDRNRFYVDRLCVIGALRRVALANQEFIASIPAQSMPMNSCREM